jgi:hypothetical protein
MASNPTCGQYQSDDAWSTFGFPSDGKFAVQRQNVVGNFGYGPYTAICGSFGTQVCASDPQESIHEFPELAGLTVIAGYDLNGRQVAQLYSGEIQGEQSYRLTFDASSLANGLPMPLQWTI